MSRSSYHKRISRLRALYPKASLSQLRGHRRKGERALSTLKPQPKYKIHHRYLTPREKAIRSKSTNILARVRRGLGSLSSLSREYGTTPETVRKHTGAFKKEGFRWKGTSYDKIERVMRINENGYEVDITINDSRYASTIGKYHNAVKDFLESGDESYLKPFEGRQIRDTNGNWHTLDTDPDNLYDIQDRRAEEETWSIYKE